MIKTPQELITLMRLNRDTVRPVAPEDLKYVIYARKSTDNKDQQTRSLADQLAECREYANRNNLIVKGEILEAESAKESDIRPKFRKLLNDIKQGVIHGIIAWHPDRLARNMKEAGEIIDLLDKGVIKDLRFANFSFQNDTSGKTLLGITFVLSKQYSDTLSDAINRGNYRSILEGKSIGKTPHGYYRDEDFFLWPDEDNFLIIKQAFAMRLEGRSLEEIAKYINESGYTKITKSGHKHYGFSLKRVSDLLQKEIYAGVLRHGDNVIALEEIYSFVPAVSVADFCRINGLDEGSIKAQGVGKNKVVGTLLRGLLKCGNCGHNMTSAITHKYNKAKTKKRQYYYYRCDYCKKNSTRAFVVLDGIYQILQDHLFITPEVYDHYLSEMHREVKRHARENERQLKSLRHQKATCIKRIESIKDYLLKQKHAGVRDAFSHDLQEKQKALSDIEGQIHERQVLKNEPERAIMDFERFIELFKEMAVSLRKTTDLQQKDTMLREIFLNLIFNKGKIVSYTLKEPFAMFVKQGLFRSGGGHDKHIELFISLLQERHQWVEDYCSSMSNYTLTQDNDRSNQGEVILL